MLVATCPHLSQLLSTHVIAPHVAPGACASVTTRIEDEWWTLHAAAGNTCPEETYSVTTTSWFDLASISKSIVAFCFARCVDAGLLRADTQLAEVLHELHATHSAKTPLSWLLAHRAGLEAHVELFAPLRDARPFDRDRALSLAADSIRRDVQPSGDAGYPALYSDLGYVLLGEAMQRASNQPLDELIDDQLEQVGIRGIGSARVLNLARDCTVMPTESVAWRGGMLRACVHDENAFALSGSGCSGHAGLFGNVIAVTHFARLMLELHDSASDALSPRSVDMLLRRRHGDSLRAGFDGKSTGASSVGGVLSDATFGHLGFTGTSFWCDPAQNVAVVLLTNRVCPTRDNTAIRRVRPVVHDALAQRGLDLRQSMSLLS